MPKTFITSDHHFGHALMVRGVDSIGEKLRPFTSIEEMDEFMIDAWNSTVGKHDKVYHLGDFVMNRRYLQYASKLAGDIVLIKGNHDNFKLNDYTKYFRDIRAYWQLDGMILSHIPVHPMQKRRYALNIHGHTHSWKVLDHNGVPDPWYYPVCVEQHKYKPVHFEEIRKWKQQLSLHE